MSLDKQGKKQYGFEQLFSQQLLLSISAIEQQLARFYLYFLANEEVADGLQPAESILLPQQRKRLPLARGKWEERALKRQSLLKKTI